MRNTKGTGSKINNTEKEWRHGVKPQEARHPISGAFSRERKTGRAASSGKTGVTTKETLSMDISRDSADITSLTSTNTMKENSERAIWRGEELRLGPTEGVTKETSRMGRKTEKALFTGRTGLNT